MLNEAVDEVRRLEQLMNRILKNTRYIWLKNPSSLTKKQLTELGGLKEMNLKTVRAYNIKLALQEFWKFEDRDTAEAYVKKWYFWATHSKLPAIVKAPTLGIKFFTRNIFQHEVPAIEQYLVTHL